MRFWDVSTRNPKGDPFVKPTYGVSRLALSSKGILALGGIEGKVQLWDIKSLEPVGVPLPTHVDQEGAIMFSLDGSTVVTTSARGPALVRRVSSYLDAIPMLCGQVGEMTSEQWARFAADDDQVSSCR